MNLKTIAVILVSGLYFFGCHYWYCCNVKAACYGCGPATETVASAPVIPLVQAEDPIRFVSSNATPIITAAFGEKKMEWLSEKSGDNLLEITGVFYSDETAPNNFEDMGMARADAIRKLLNDVLPDERIRMKSEQLPDSPKESDTPFEGFYTNWISFAESKVAVVDFGDKAIIYFPQNKRKADAIEEINRYISSLAERVKESGETIFITGHTDDEGEIRKNLRIGENRAMRIRRLLRLEGVKREQLVVSSKGELEPIAENDTKDGRYQNRRIVLEIKARI